MAFNGSLWGRRVKLTGIAPVANASGFVALITETNLPAEAMDTGVNSALNGGGDLRFATDDAGVNQLPLDVRYFVTSATAGNRKAQLWIRFDSYESTAREVWMFYNRAGQTQPAATDPFGRNAVRQNRLFHLPLDDNTYEDVTGNNHFGVANSSPVQTASNHPFGGEWTLFDGSNDYLTLNNSAGVGTNLSEFTISIIHRGVTSTNDGGLINAFATNSIAGSTIGMRTTTTRFKGGGSGIAFGTADGVSPPPDGTTSWLMLTLTSDGLRAYRNGSQIAFKAGTASPVQGNTPVSIGSYYDFSSNWCENAYMAEAYISNQYTPVEDAKLAYDNQSAPDTFWTTGTPEDTGDGTINLDFTDITVQPTVDVLSLIGDVSLSFNDITTQVTVDPIGLQRYTSLNLTGATITLTIDNVSLQRNTSVHFNDVTLQSTIDVLTLIGDTILDFTDITIQSSIDPIGLQRHTSTAFDDVTVSVTVDQIGLQRYTNLELDDVTIDLFSDLIALVVGKAVEFDDVTLQPTIDTTTLTANTSIQLNDITVQPTVDGISINRYTNLEFDDITVQPSVDLLALITQYMPDIHAGNIKLISQSNSYQLDSKTRQYRIIKNAISS